MGEELFVCRKGVIAVTGTTTDDTDATFDQVMRAVHSASPASSSAFNILHSAFQ